MRDPSAQFLQQATVVSIDAVRSFGSHFARERIVPVPRSMRERWPLFAWT